MNQSHYFELFVLPTSFNSASVVNVLTALRSG